MVMQLERVLGVCFEEMLRQEILGIYEWCRCIKEKEISMSVTVIDVYV